MQDADPCGMVKVVCVVWGGGATLIENAEEGIDDDPYGVGFLLIAEDARDQCSCAFLVDKGVVDQPMHGSGEVGPPMSRSPVLLLIIAVAQDSKCIQNVFTPLWR